MSKEYLEAFNRITLHTECDNDGSYDCLNFEDDCKLVNDALTRLNLIDNLKPSEALEELNKFKGIEISSLPFKSEDGAVKEVDLNEVRFVGSTLNNEFRKFVNIIEQALLQAQKDKAKIEKLKHDNAILHAELDAFKKIAFKDKSK